MLKIENILIASYGIITVIVFIALLVAGGLFASLHAFLFREVSFIVSPYVPVRDITIPLYQAYNYYLILFSFVLSHRMASIYAKLGSLYLILSAIVGLILVQYPLDPHGISGSTAGMLHIVIVLFMSFYTTVALLLLSYAFKRTRHLRWLANYSTGISLCIAVISFVTGVFAFFSKPYYVGITEKLPIGIFLSWIILTGIGILHSDNRIKHYIWQGKRE